MKICIAGAGAIGAYLGARMAAAGAEVCLIARGAHLAAMQANGLRVIAADGAEEQLRLPCAASGENFGPQDVVVVASKAHDAPGLVPAVQPLLGPDTSVVTAMNGVPWWYFYGHPGPHADRRLSLLDPGRVQWDGIGPERIVGAVIWAAAEMPAPGVVRHKSGSRIPVGEPDGSRSGRAQRIARMLADSGLKSPVRTDIRAEIWLKLWGNLAFNPVSVLTHATLEAMARDPAIRAVIRTMMVEAEAVAEALGIRFPLDIDARIRGAEEVGPHPTSTLQDLRRGKPLELDALVGAVVEIARLVGVSTPTLDIVDALALRRAKEAGCYRGLR